MAITTKDATSISKNTTETEMVLPSRLELLPFEIRQHIYGYLGFPIARVAWLSPWEIRSCEYFFWVAKNPNAISKDGRVQLTKIQFTRPFVHKEDIILHGTEFHTEKRIILKTRPCLCVRKCPACKRKICPCGKICAYCASHKPLRCEMSMMSLNKNMYEELCHMLYSRIEVEFEFELSERKVHYVTSEWHTKGLRYNGGHNKHKGIGAARMAMTNSTMSFLTHISLHTMVGTHNTTLTPTNTRDFYRRVLRRQGDTIRFVADHCTNLITLRYSPNLMALDKSKHYTVVKLASAFERLFNKCDHLEILEIEAFQHSRGCGVKEAIARLASKETKVLKTMTRVEWVEGERSGTEEWAKSVLLYIRNRASSLLDRPGSENPHGRHL